MSSSFISWLPFRLQQTIRLISVNRSIEDSDLDLSFYWRTSNGLKFAQYSNNMYFRPHFEETAHNTRPWNCTKLTTANRHKFTSILFIICLSVCCRIRYLVENDTEKNSVAGSGQVHVCSVHS